MNVRTLLAVVLGISVLGGLWLCRQQSARIADTRGHPSIEPLAASSSPAPMMAEPAASDRSPVLDPPSPISAESSPSSTDASLEVLVVSAGAREPLEGVLVSPSRRDEISTRWIEQVESARGDLDDPPRTGSDGRVVLRLPPATACRLELLPRTVRTERKTIEVEPLAAGARETRVVELENGYDLAFHGRVVSRETGAPVPGASAHFFRKGDGLVTGGEGRFELLGPSWEARRVVIAAEAYASVEFDLVPGHEVPEREQVFELDRVANLVVRVLDARRQPYWGARVRIELPHHAETHETRADGRVEFDALPPSLPIAFEVEWGMTSFQPPPISIVPGETRELELVLPAGPTLRGRFQDDEGVPIVRRSMYLTRPDASRSLVMPIGPTTQARTITDDDGRFEFADVPAGEWLVGPSRKPWSSGGELDPQPILPIGEIVRVEAGADPPELVLRAQHGLSIGGTVVGPDGRPVRGCEVRADAESGLSVRVASDSQGQFEIGPLAAGPHVLSAEPREGQWNQSRSNAVDASAGDKGVVLALRAGGSIGCEIRSAGKPVFNGGDSAYRVKVRIVGPDDGSDSRAAPFKTVAGRCVFESLAPGTYALLATADNPPEAAVLRDVKVVAGERTRDLVLELAPAAHLRVRSEREVGACSISVHQQGLVVATVRIGPGGECKLVVPAGRLDLEARGSSGGMILQESLQLAPRDEREIVLPIR
jgi:hypothetical protein